MSQRSDFEHIGDLIRLCAQTLRLIADARFGYLSDCPFRHIVLELEQLAEEVKDIAADLPPGRDEYPM